MGHSGILHKEAEPWSLTDSEIEQLSVGPEIPIMDVDDTY